MADRDTPLATDDWTSFGAGERINNSANWQDTNPTNGGPIIELTNGPICQGSSGQAAPENGLTCVWTGAGAFDDDQWAEVTIRTSWQSASFQTGVILRSSTDINANRDCYFFVVQHNFPGDLTTTLGKIVDGVYTQFHQEEITWADDDLLSLEVEGSAIRGMQNGVVINASFDVVDTDLTTGNPGIQTAGARPAGDLGALDWAAGNFTSGGPSIGPIAGRHLQNLMSN